MRCDWSDHPLITRRQSRLSLDLCSCLQTASFPRVVFSPAALTWSSDHLADVCSVGDHVYNVQSIAEGGQNQASNERVHGLVKGTAA